MIVTLIIATTLSTSMLGQKTTRVNQTTYSQEYGLSCSSDAGKLEIKRLIAEVEGVRVAKVISMKCEE